MNKHSIISYYEELQQHIDLKCEQYLSDPKTTQDERLKLNSIREAFVSEINKILNHSIKRLEHQDQDDLFCFIIPGQDKKSIGRLVITNVYISSDLRSRLLDDKDNFIILDVLRRLLKLYEEFDLIDLSNRQNNILKNVYLDLDESQNEDFSTVEKILNLNQIETLSIRLKAIDEPKLDFLILKLENIKQLELNFYGRQSLNDSEFEFIRNINQTEISICFNSFKSINFDKLKTVENMTELRIHESSIKKPLNLNGFKSLKYLSLNLNALGNIQKTDLQGIDGLVALDLGVNEITCLNEHIFDSLQNLEYLNLRQNYIESIDVGLLNVLGNLEFLSLINGFYDTTDHFSIDLDNLVLPNLKYLAIRANRVPVFKNLNLEFLELKGLKDCGFENLSLLTKLKGLRLAFSYETIVFPPIEESVFLSMKSLVFLNIRFDFTYEAQSIIDNEEYYKSLINGDKVKFFHNYDKHLLEQAEFMFTVSKYETISDFLRDELKFSKHVSNASTNYHDIFYKNFFYK